MSVYVLGVRPNMTDSDQPGSSGIQHNRADQQDSEDEETPSDPLAEAREDFIEKVSVAGWKEAFGEHVTWISHCFKIVLLICTGFCLYYIAQLIDGWRHIGYMNELNLIANVESLPAPNVTICAQVYMNDTFIRQNVTIPDDIKVKFQKRTGPYSMNEFLRQLTLFLSPITRVRWDISYELLAYFNKVLRMNPQMADYSAFLSVAMPSCPSMLKRCWFDGQEFDCCDRAVRSIDDDGICYLLAVSTLLVFECTVQFRSSIAAELR